MDIAFTNVFGSQTEPGATYTLPLLPRTAPFPDIGIVRSTQSQSGLYRLEVPMTSPFSRTLLPLGLSIALLAACKPTKRVENPSPATPGADITSEDIQRAPGQSIEEILKGRVAGVTVTQGEGGIAVRIRGATSIYGSNEPLYVLDGVPITPGPGGSLTGIDPYDIESIEVLKDPTDTALYGMRGANGVIVIKTKRAMRRRNPS